MGVFRHFFAYTLLLCATFASAADAVDYVPHFHGAIRSRLEINTCSGDYRFQVRNARLIMQGQVADGLDYFVQTDLCDRGEMKILDAYGRVRLMRGLTVQAGQFSIAYGVENVRSPQNYVFTNLAYIAENIMSHHRAVGAKLAYALPSLPLTVEGGVFNPSVITNHTAWHRSVGWSGRATWLVGQWSVSGSFASLEPYETRANFVDAAVVWDDKHHWLVTAEYMYEHYTRGAAPVAHGWMAYADWHTAVRVGTFNRWSVQGRFDGMTRHAPLKDVNDVDPRRNRLTLGTTLSCVHGAMHADVRLNYERCFALSDADRLVAELVIRF